MTAGVLNAISLVSSPNKCYDLPLNDHSTGSIVRIFNCNWTPAQAFKVEAQGGVNGGGGEGLKQGGVTAKPHRLGREGRLCTGMRC